MFPNAPFTLFALLALVACNRPLERTDLQPAPSGTGRVEVRVPAKLSGIETGRTNARGEPLRVACETCHSLREPGKLPERPEQLGAFHRRLTLNHGSLRCASCHVPGREDRLTLAGGDSVAMTDVISLCGQCHGPQKRDFDRGSHGGMQGYWDRRSGNAVKNNCVDCHDPHTPQYVGGKPVLKPRDRFLGEKGAHP